MQPGDKDTDHLIAGNTNGRTSREEEDEELDALRLDLDGIDERPERDGGTGGISVDQRKALWWKNTLITGLFVASWYVPPSLART